jgi:sterol desaturase/sphingolipid hydroxylase (fatty acid hydroxylase superfamily)
MLLSEDVPDSSPVSLALQFWPLIVAAITFEIAWYILVRRRAYPWREMALSTAMMLMRQPMKLLYLVVVAPVAGVAWSLRVATVPLDTWWGVALLFVGVELCYYWSHRAMHMVRWMWASHAVHHSPNEIHLASAYRLGVTDIFSGGWLFYVPLYLLGFNPLAVAGMLAINLFYQFWLHTDVVGKLGALEWVLNTPSHHRVHHASNATYLDRNFGGVVIVWDRLFGTFAEEHESIRIKYGLVHPIDTSNPLKLAFFEWIAMARDALAARSWRARLHHLFGRPGAALRPTP